MAFSFKLLSKRFLIVTNLVLVIFFVLPGLIPYTDPAKWWCLGFLGLGFPYLLVLVFLFFVFWLIIKPRYSILSLFAMLLCWKQVSVLFKFSGTEFNYTKDEKSLRVLSWNVKIFEGLKKEQGSSVKAANDIIDFIKASNADVLCLQEFNQYDSTSSDKNHIRRLIEAGYPYYIFSSDYQKQKIDYHSGVAIFSKIPLKKQQKIPFQSNPESIVFADVEKNGQTFRIYTTHLQSFKFNSADYRSLNDIKNKGELANQGSKNILVKLKRGFEQRGLQAQQIQTILDECEYPEIICGDFNDVPNSYAYWQIRGSRRDAFIEKGQGIGRTFISLAPTLRIDYIMCDNRIKVNQFAVANKKFSDHMPVIADLQSDKKP